MSLPNTDENGVVQTKANGVPVNWNRGLGYDVNGNLCVTSALSATDVWQNGWRMDSMGRLVVNQSTPEGKPFVYNAGWPCDKNTGAIITQQNVPASTDPRIAGVAVGPLGGVYMTEGGYIWTPLELWPDGVDSAGMWISPSLLTASFNDYTGTTPVAAPGTVADSANPVGLALDIRAGATALADPGNHMLQSTSAARPVASALVNLMTYSEDFSNAAWIVQGATKTTGVTAPDGTSTAMTLSITSNTGNNLAQLFPDSLSLPRTASAMVRGAAGQKVFIGADDAAPQTLVTFTGEWQEVENTQTASGNVYFVFEIYNRSGGGHLPNVTFDIWHPQLNLGSTALTYQRVNTDSDYDATGITPFQLYDGTDDGMATASFTAGTLSNTMDCMIAVRRDSAAATYLISDTASRGFFEWESGNSSRPDVSAGTPTYYVDGVAVTATRGALFTALTAGEWHILEARGLDLSTWVAFEVSSLTSYRLNGVRGDIMLFPSPADTTDRDKARQYLADKYGVTLPAWVGRYNYVTPPTSSIPVAGEIVHGDNLLNKLNFSKTDLDGQTYTGPPLTTGHEVKIGDQVYTLVAPPVDFSSYITLTIEPATQLADGTYPVLVY